MEPFDVSRGAKWCDGLNAFFPPGELSRLVQGLLQQELEEGQMALTEARERFGRGLLNTRYIGEGERVGDATCLWFDCKDQLNKFSVATPTSPIALVPSPRYHAIVKRRVPRRRIGR